MSDTEKTTVMAINRRTAGPSHFCDNKYLFIYGTTSPPAHRLCTNQPSSLFSMSFLKLEDNRYMHVYSF